MLSSTLFTSPLPPQASYGNASTRRFVLHVTGVFVRSFVLLVRSLLSCPSLPSPPSLPRHPHLQVGRDPGLDPDSDDDDDDDIDTGGNKASDLWWRFIAVFIAAPPRNPLIARRVRRRLSSHVAAFVLAIKTAVFRFAGHGRRAEVLHRAPREDKCKKSVEFHCNGESNQTIATKHTDALFYSCRYCGPDVILIQEQK